MLSYFIHFPYFPLSFTFKIFKILSCSYVFFIVFHIFPWRICPSIYLVIISKLLNKHSCLLYKHLLNFTSWYTLNIYFLWKLTYLEDTLTLRVQKFELPVNITCRHKTPMISARKILIHVMANCNVDLCIYASDIIF